VVVKATRAVQLAGERGAARRGLRVGAEAIGSDRWREGAQLAELCPAFCLGRRGATDERLRREGVVHLREL